MSKVGWQNDVASVMWQASSPVYTLFLTNTPFFTIVEQLVWVDLN